MSFLEHDIPPNVARTAQVTAAAFALVLCTIANCFDDVAADVMVARIEAGEKREAREAQERNEATMERFRLAHIAYMACIKLDLNRSVEDCHAAYEAQGGR